MASENHATDVGLLDETLAADARVPDPVEEKEGTDGADETLTILANFELVELESGKKAKMGLSLPAICDDLAEIAGRWPKRVDKMLFVPGLGHVPRYLETPAQLFAWFDARCHVDWGKASDMVGQERFFAHLQETAESYEALESVPHWPPLPGTYYMHPPLPETDGRFLKRFVDYFAPLTSVDRALLVAFVLCLCWGGPPGSRPAWLFVPEEGALEGGRGVGKSKTIELCAELVGGMIEISPLEDIVGIKKRLLSPAARTLRLARIDNIKTYRFSWADLEGLITSPIISGHRMYRGEGRRPNTLTWALSLNGASLSRDMAKRVIVVKLRRPEYSPAWESDVRGYIEEYRWHILNDARRLLQS